MKTCRSIKRNIVAFLSGELGEQERAAVQVHLSSCSVCRTEMEEVAKIFGRAKLARKDMEDVMESIDWDRLPQKIAAHVLDERRKPGRTILKQRSRFFLLRPAFRPLLAGLFAGVLLGSLVTFLMLRLPGEHRVKNPGFFTNPAVFDRVELEMARRETLDYLDQSQILLLDFIQASSRQPAREGAGHLSVQRARNLLAKKKYIDPQLEKFRMAKAKAICDQIEILFYELALLRDRMTKEEFQTLQSVIRKRQLLLKIKIVKKELEQSEV